MNAMDRAPEQSASTEASPSSGAAAGVDRLLELIRRLRSADGCPWDRAQRLDDLRAYLLEEAHETADAIDRQDWRDLCSELGDLLFQVCFVAELAAEQGRFSLDDAAREVLDKMVARHPHVFGAGERLETAEEVASEWGRRKGAGAQSSLLEGVPASLPALTAAHRLGQKAAAVGFDWTDATQVLEKVREEVGELEDAMAQAAPEAVEAELGDLLLSVTSLARQLGCDAERALARANLRFRARFGHLERALGQRLTDRRSPAEESRLRAEMERLWEEAKALESEDPT